MEAWKTLFQNQEFTVVFGLTGFVLAILSIAIAILTFRWSQKYRAPVWALRSINLVRDYSVQLPQLEVLFNQQRVENLTKTKVVFWNAGNIAVRAGDMAQNDPLTVRLVGRGVILAANLQTSSISANNCGVTTIDEKSAVINFSFFDQQQGLVLELLHTGDRDAYVDSTGTFIDSRTLSKKTALRKFELVILRHTFFRILAAAVIVGMVMLVVATSFETPSWVRTLGLYLAIIPILFTMFLLYDYIFPRDMNSIRLPRELNRFFED